MSSAFAHELRRIRSERALSLGQLARLVPCHRGYLSQLEAGTRRPSRRFAERLDEALGAGGILAGLASPEPDTAIPQLPDWDGGERLASGVSGRVRPDRAMRDYLAQSLALQRSAEDTAGARLVLTPTLGQLTAVETLRSEASGPLRRELLALESQYAQFIGWLYQDLEQRGPAEQWYAKALSLAHEAGDANMIASVLSMRSNMAWGFGDVRRALDLGEAACRPGDATPGVLALSQQQAARAHATAGDRAAAERALDEALRLSERAAAEPDREPAWIYFLDPARVEMQRALALRELGDYRGAADLFRHSIDLLPDQYRRDRGQNLARLALALAAAGEREEARARADEARGLAEETGSDRTLAELARVEKILDDSRPE